MTPDATDHVVRLYALIIGGILALAGVTLAILGRVLRKNVRAPWITYRGWLVMAPIVLGCIYAGRAPVVVLFTMVAVLAFREFARATGLYADWRMTGLVYLAIVSVGIVSLVPDPNTGSPGWYGLFMTLPVYAIAAVLIVPIVRNQAAGQLQAVSLAILGFVYIGWMFGHVVFLASSPHAYGYLLYLLLAVEASDVAAYTFGKAFGRHTLRSRISPRKTVEGAAGAFAVAMALPWLLRFSFPHFGTRELLLTGLIVGIGGQLGDLSVSFIKRDVGIKDMGAAIPGHGGFLDRIDSLIYAAPLFLHMSDYYYKHW